MASNTIISPKTSGYGYPLWIALFAILAVTSLAILSFITFNVTQLKHREIAEAKAASNKIFAALAVTTLEPVISEDIAGLETIIEQIMQQVSEIESITVTNENATSLIHREKQPSAKTQTLETFVRTITFEEEVFGEISIVWDTGEKILAHRKNGLHLWIITCIPLVFLTIILGVSLHFLLFRPLATIQQRILSIKNGDLTLTNSYSGSREIQVLQVTVNDLCQSQITEKQQRKELVVAKQRADEELLRRKQTEVEREQLQTELHQAHKMEAIGMLAGRVAHDLNNVLSGIVSYPELLLVQLPADSPHVTTVKAIKNSGEKAAAIVQDLLTLARRGITNTETINVNSVIGEYLESPEYKKLMSFHPNTHLITNFEKHLFNINGSAIHLSKTIMNLITNAAESMPEGGEIVISTDNRYIDQPIHGYDKVDEGDYVTISIADSGIGIPMEDKEKIFEPFFTSKEMGRSGTGLGMAVVWGTIKDHNGYIDIQSQVGSGTTFILYLPITRQSLTEKIEQVSIATYLGNGETILIVDDVELQRVIATDILVTLGYDVVSVSNGEAAVAHIKNNHVDIILLDMIMDPGIDGIETLKRMKKIKPSLQAILASGYSEVERIEEMRELGISQNIKKPYSLEKIGLAIKEGLAKTC